jgi:hypothetical protein
MSCGGSMLSGFSCGARRFEKYKFTSDKPSNPILHKENEKKLNDLLRIRDEQDKRVFPPIIATNNTIKVANVINMTESFVIPEHDATLDQGHILYYPTSDVKEKRD